MTLLPITLREYEVGKGIMLRYSIPPSDALHVAVMLNNSIKRILTEDSDFDRIQEVSRIWIE